MLIWNIDEYFNTVGKIPEEQKLQLSERNEIVTSRIQKSLQSYLSDTKPSSIPKLKNSVKLVGHTKNVEDVVFNPEDDQQLCSVGVDRNVLFWDVLSSNNPCMKVFSVCQSIDRECSFR